MRRTWGLFGDLSWFFPFSAPSIVRFIRALNSWWYPWEHSSQISLKLQLLLTTPNNVLSLPHHFCFKSPLNLQQLRCFTCKLPLVTHFQLLVFVNGDWKDLGFDCLKTISLPSFSKSWFQYWIHYTLFFSFVFMVEVVEISRIFEAGLKQKVKIHLPFCSSCVDLVCSLFVFSPPN